MLCIQELDPFGYAPLEVSLKNFIPSSHVCVLKILNIFLKKSKKSWSSPPYEDEELMHLVVMTSFVQVIVIYRTSDRGQVQCILIYQHIN